MLITRDGPGVIDQIFVENRRYFFIPHMHSTPALILIVLSRYRHTISDEDVAPEKGAGVPQYCCMDCKVK